MRLSKTRLFLTALYLFGIGTVAQAADMSIELHERVMKSRAVEAAIWGMPTVNYDRMHQAAAKAGARANQIVYWSRPSDWKNKLLTPNPNTIYLLPFMDTSEVGPVVLEIPPTEGGAIVGSIDDVWQMPYEDVGKAGVDNYPVDA